MLLEDPGSLRILILNKDLPVFPGWISVEYLHTTRLARLARPLGLVSAVHTRDQAEKTRHLAEAGVRLYLWQSEPLLEDLSLGKDEPVPPQARHGLRRLIREAYALSRTLPSRPTDTGINDYVFRNLSAGIVQALTVENWDVLIVVQSSCARWLDYLPRFRTSVLVMHDIRALVYARQAQVAPALLKRFLSLVQAALYRRFERAYCHRYDLVVTVSPEDERWVRQHYRPRHVVTIPLPLDTLYFAPMDDEPEVNGRIVFTGLMAHPPNVDAVCFFAREVLPLVRAVIPDAEFWIVGRSPLPEVAALVDCPGVVVTGFVPDIRPFIARAMVVVVPLRFGSGVRNKILEAWGMQKCVVSTRIGAEGLAYEDGINILIADGAPALADRVIQAIQNQELRTRIRSRGREVVIQQHDPERLAERYNRAILDVSAEQTPDNGLMRTAIDLRWMIPGKAGGAENLSRSFLAELIDLDRHNQYTLLIPPQVKYDFDLRHHPNFQRLVADGPRVAWHRLVGRARQRVYRHLRLDDPHSASMKDLKFARDLKADIALSMTGYIVPDLYPLRNVLVVLDLQHEYYPEFFSPSVLNERKRVYSASIEQADYLIAISDHTRQTVLERFKIEPERISVAHLAADPIFSRSALDDLGESDILTRYGLRKGSYLFFPAHTWPHKNHLGVLKALVVLRDSFHLSPLLVLTGAPRDAQPEILDFIRRTGLGQQVRFLGYRPTEDMPALYRGAAALVFPSFFEGFGMPLVEAMWCRCPIVCSNTTSLPEIAGDAALLVDPASPEALADALSRVLTDTELRRSLVERGQRRAQCFSWRDFALKAVSTLHVVEEM